MAGGAGHVNDMKGRLKRNRAMLTSKREKYAKYEGRYAKHDMPIKLYSKKISHPELRHIKKHIQAKAKKENREMMWISIITLSILGLLFYWLFV